MKTAVALLVIVALSGCVEQAKEYGEEARQQLEEGAAAGKEAWQEHQDSESGESGQREEGRHSVILGIDDTWPCQGYRVAAKAFVQDEAGDAIEDAWVESQWRLPDRSLVKSAKTNADGKAVFSIELADEEPVGNATVTVTAHHEGTIKTASQDFQIRDCHA